MKQTKQLLSKTWQPLETHLNECGKFPGVYIIAYSNKNLENKKINIKDIFYVGMTNSLGGLNSRLKQFRKASNGKRGHSGGNRFFGDKLAKKGYHFFAQSISINCKVSKEKRTPKDLLKMGDVAKLEYEVIAEIKDKLGREPELNKK